MRGGCAQLGPLGPQKWGRAGPWLLPDPQGGRGAWWVQSPAGEQVRAWETWALFQPCPEPVTLVQSLPGGSVRPTDP